MSRNEHDPPRKIGDQALKSMASLGLEELRSMIYPGSNVAQQSTEPGMWGDRSYTYGTLLSQAGVTPRETMELMRHTDLRLTMKVYTDPRVFDLAHAVEKLPIPVRSQGSVQGTQLASGGWRKSGTHLSAGMGSCTAVIGRREGGSGGLQIMAYERDRQQKTPSGGNGVGTRQVGLEPT